MKRARASWHEGKAPKEITLSYALDVYRKASERAAEVAAEASETVTFTSLDEEEEPLRDR